MLTRMERSVLSIRRKPERRLIVLSDRNERHQLKENFEQKVARFLKDSDERLATLKRATESKRGGRGARRG
ncbi:hypothetical protein LSPH24S_00354 [Lysinibacillus sphaericus]